MNPMSESSFYEEDVAIDLVRSVYKRINEQTGPVSLEDQIELVMQLCGAIDTIKDLKQHPVWKVEWEAISEIARLQQIEIKELNNRLHSIGSVV